MFAKRSEGKDEKFRAWELAIATTRYSSAIATTGYSSAIAYAPMLIAPFGATCVLAFAALERS